MQAKGAERLVAEVWKVTSLAAHPDEGDNDDIRGPAGKIQELSGKVPH